ncbi:TIGR03621 family F420-dependent LLM class oxidoreductase [Amycolatopsis sp. NPDC059657]|uniref:TIGR03621 family F420-dependent LLM class oxidoreductase n=1 Tax=Amycolatopsis sp. NPDC059657 TaxID=3346899 RepID=UPI00366A9AB7
MTPFRFATQARTAADARQWREKARKAEELGYSSLLVPDHLNDHWAPLVSLTIAAEATSTLKVGSLMFNNEYRHPLLLAREFAMLADACEGRVEFGIGAGWKDEDFTHLGLPFDAPGVRIGRLAESVRILKQFWSGGEVDFSGRHYTVRAAPGQPFAKVPLMLGGGGRRMLTLAAREADIVGFNATAASGTVDADMIRSMTAGSYAERVGWVREAAGERFAGLELQCLTPICQLVPDRAETIENIAKYSALTPEEIAESPAFLIGSAEEICETLEERREKFGFTYWVLPEAEMERFAPIVERLTGR